MASANMLSVDNLLTIFNVLNLFDKLTAMRVCTAWYNIFKSTHAWKVINFFDKGPVMKRQKDRVHRISTFPRTYFPSDENTICEFLETFAGVGLQEVYLSFVSDKVMETLRKKCPNLKTLFFHKAILCNLKHRCKLDIPDLDAISVDEIIYIPPKLRCLEVFAGFFPRFSTSCLNDKKLKGDYMTQDEQILSLLGQCHDLTCITLEGFRLSDKGIQTLTASLRLKELDIINPVARYNHLSKSTLLDGVLTASAGSLSCLQRLRLDCKSWLREVCILDRLPSCIAHWSKLRVLALKGVECSDDSFEMMIPGLLNLHSLELEGNIVTSHIISMVGKNLKKVTFLEVWNGHYSDECLESLASHPSLEQLWIYKGYSNQSDLARSCKWLHTLYSVLTTLQKIKHVKMEGYRLIYLYSQDKFPVIESAKIEIHNVEQNDPNDDDHVLIV